MLMSERSGSQLEKVPPSQVRSRLMFVHMNFRFWRLSGPNQFHWAGSELRVVAVCFRTTTLSSAFLPPPEISAAVWQLRSAGQSFLRDQQHQHTHRWADRTAGNWTRTPPSRPVEAGPLGNKSKQQLFFVLFGFNQLESQTKCSSLRSDCSGSGAFKDPQKYERSKQVVCDVLVFCSFIFTEWRENFMTYMIPVSFIVPGKC